MHQSSLRQAVLAALAFSLLLALMGCGSGSADVLGKAYVAPATLNLRRQLTQKNSTVAMLKHGQSVDILDVRRRFVKIRTEKGVVGWVDALDLLTPEQMRQILRERRQALSLPSEGAASAYEPLNVHIEPSRQAPAFAQIPEGGFVQVLSYQAAAKTAGPAKPPSFVFEHPEGPPRKSRKEKQGKIVSHLPLKPAPPKPPANWQALSYGHADAEAEMGKMEASQPAAEAKKPVVMEEWALVRTKSDEVGWVLARNLMMAIPDQVAQYAEGRRITSYFDLGAVNDDEKGVKHNWLWTTLSASEPFDFDSWRVFLWNRRHHRYETSYRQRDLEGYFPVHVDTSDANTAGPTFAIITKDDDGKLRRRRYLFDGTRVHLTGTEDYHPGPALEASKPETVSQATLPRSAWLNREWAALKRKLFGGS